jgi:glycosyltransferase involved in cell wall biosynthesis
MIGNATMNVESLAQHSNVKFLGRQPYESLPAYCKGFDVALIPFPISEVTLHANPLKAREYLAAGLPIVSTAIPEVEVLGQCLIGKTHEEFIQRIHDALKKPGPEPQRSQRMAAHSWSSRLDEVLTALSSLSTTH